ncbi:MAG: PQQ-dependent sugar dehydrogenase [Pirellulales bacterium]|nr:PQQ-dependent sugar dehydrogenase [Pirellulales bacterium]
MAWQLACALALGSTWGTGSFAQEADVAATPAANRVLWHNTRLTGSPEPPPPYTVERTFAKIEWKAPIYLAPVPGTQELVAILQGGEADRPAKIVRLVDDPETAQMDPVLEMDRRLIYGLTFHPRFQENGYVYVFSNGPWDQPDRANRISRFTATSRSPLTIDPATELPLLEWESAGHDGGDLAFGLDGMLYITSGDGTSDSDTFDSGQDVGNLLGAVLRIDVDHTAEDCAYSIPVDNPFLGIEGARRELWAIGLRNPWRMCVDERTGHVWVGNNGQDQWETAHLICRGDNCGWSVYEGSHPFYLHRQRGPAPIVPPTIEHPHSEFRSLTGGVVYYGHALPELDGVYVYGDYSTGKIWGARHDGDTLLEWRELADTTLQIAAFRVDQRGELLVVDHGGGIYRLVPQVTTIEGTPFPTRLSETGLFTSVTEHRPAPGAIPYEVNAPAWADGASAARFLALDGETKIAYTATGGWNFENGAVLVQTLSLPCAENDKCEPRRIETRLLVRRQNEWTGYSYRWNEAQSDAELVDKNGAKQTLIICEEEIPGESSQIVWRFPGRTECLACHSRAANYVLGLSEVQMNRPAGEDRTGENQLERFARGGLFQDALPKPAAELAHLVDPYDRTALLKARARSYLHANCAACHVAAGGGNARMELGFATAADATNLIEARPQHDTFGMANAMLVAPGHPEQSVLLHRLSHRGRGQMPPLVVARVDQRAVELFRDWIAELKPKRTFVRDWTLDELTPELVKLAEPRSRESGERLFAEIGCAQCHRLGTARGTVGPDLTDLARRQTPAQVLESIVHPSKVIPEAYAATVIETDEGLRHTGRIEQETELHVVLRTGAGDADVVSVKKATIVARGLAEISNMPAGMLNVLTLEEVLDLLAYLGQSPAASAEPKATD